MLALLSRAELPAPQRGASVVPSQGSLTARLVRLSGTVHALRSELPEDLDESQRLGVARALDRLDDAISQACAAAGLVRRSTVPPAPAEPTESALGATEVL